jgi:hypothetical protein
MPSSLVDNDLFVDFDAPADYDSEGNPLTQEQASFFSNSKCVDEDGSLYKVYRAGSKNYDAFDKSRIGSGAGSIYGKGFYFGCDRESVKIYGDIVNEYYLNLKNPYRYEAVDYEEDALYNVDTFIEVLERNNFKVTPELRQQLEEDVLENDGGLDTLIELTCGVDKATDFFKACGFDGIMNLDILDFVAFEPNQIKLSSNKNPTNSERLAASLQRKNI